MKEWETHIEKWIVKGLVAERKGISVPRESILAKEGLRFITFAFPAEQWEVFIDKICQGDKPNDVVWAVLMKELMRQKV